MKYKELKDKCDKLDRLAQNNLRPELEFEMELNNRLKKELKKVRQIILDKDYENTELNLQVTSLHHLLTQKRLINDGTLDDAVNDGHLRCVRCQAIPRECSCKDDDF